MNCYPFSNPNRQLLNAVRDGSVRDVQHLLQKSGIDVDTKTPSGGTALHYAAYSGNSLIVQMLIESGSSVNTKTPEQLTPLHVASGKGYLLIVKLLLENGANINARDMRGWTPLHWASYWGRTTNVQLLLQYGAPQRVVNMQSKTPLDFARERYHSEIVAMLEEVMPEIATIGRVMPTPISMWKEDREITPTGEGATLGAKNITLVTAAAVPITTTIENGSGDNHSCIDERKVEAQQGEVQKWLIGSPKP